MAVNDNNPLYGSFSYAGGYSLCPAGTVIPGSSTSVSDRFGYARITTGLISSSVLTNNLFASKLRRCSSSSESR